MGIIIKFILRNIKEKKLRTFLILLSISLSAALFFASSAISGTIGDKFVQRMRQYFGTSDIMMTVEDKALSKYFYLSKIERFRGRRDLEYVIGMSEGVGIYRKDKEKIAVNLWGFNWRDLQRMNPIALEREYHLLPFDGNKIIINSLTAEKYGLKLGGNLDIDINDVKHRFRIVGIAVPDGPMQEGGRTMTGILPQATLSTLLDGRGKITIAFIKVKDPPKKKQVIDELSEEFRRFSVRGTLSEEEIAEFTRGISTGFLMMCTLILFMSIFIIYTSFKVITRERLPIIGTFRSIGATKRTTDLVLFAESLFYGLVGGSVGCGLGIGILYLMSFIMTPPWVKGAQTSIHFLPIHLVGAFLLAVILSFASSFVPVVKTSKIPVKDIILNSIEKKTRRKRWRSPLGLACLAFSLAAPAFAPKSAAIWVDTGSMLLAIAGSILLIPYLTNAFLLVFERVYLYIFGNMGILAAKNLRDDKNILNNIALLAIGISSLLMINTISDSVFKELTNFYRDAKFQIWMGADRADRAFVQRILTVKGVDDVLGIYGAQGIAILHRSGNEDSEETGNIPRRSGRRGGRKAPSRSREQIMLIHGVNRNKYFDYWNFPIEGDRSETLDRLDAGRNILLSQSLRNRLNVHKGDVLTLEMVRGDKSYTVAGFFNSLMWNGSYALIPERYIRMDMKKQYFEDIFIKTTDRPDTVLDNVKKKFLRERPWVETLKKMEEDDRQNNQQIFSILQGFSVMTLLIGIFGVLNNLIISFLGRRRSMAMMRSVGMSRKQTMTMIFIESLTGGLIGGSMGVFTGGVLIAIVPYVMKAIDMPVAITYNYSLFGYSLVSGVLITVLASISPALRSSRLNIIESIKYE